MKMIFILGVILISDTTTLAQQKDHVNPPPPLRGQKDIRPKQFASVEQSAFKNIDLSPQIRNLNKLTTGEREVFAVDNLKPMSAILISTRHTSVGASYAFRIENQEYAGAILFIEILKQNNGSDKYIGHVIRPGYSDVLKLRHVNGRLFFAAEEAQRVVLD